MNFYNPPHLWHAFRGRLQNEFRQNQPHLWHALRGRLCKMNFYRTRPICGMQTIRTNSWISYALFVAEVSNDFLRKLCPIFGRSNPLVSQEFMPYCGKSSHFWQKYQSILYHSYAPLAAIWTDWFPTEFMPLLWHSPLRQRFHRWFSLRNLCPNCGRNINEFPRK